MGRVSTDSCEVDNIYAVGYRIDGVQGQVVSIGALSLDFATTIYLTNPAATLFGRADSIRGEVARINNVTLPYTGEYVLLITPNQRVVFGNYSILMNCSFPSPPTTSCTENSTTACMLNNRFRVSVLYRGAFDNGSPGTSALRKPVTGFNNAAYETSFFYFNDSNNIEMMVKMLDQGNTDSAGRRTVAVLFGSATPLRIQVTITDTLTGASKTYNSFFNEMKGTTDFTAFVK